MNKQQNNNNSPWIVVAEMADIMKQMQVRTGLKAGQEIQPCI